MKMDHNHIPLNSPYQPWPYAPNYPPPLDYHNCCNPTHFYGGPYGFRPPYPNYQLPPPPPSFHSHGFYPFPGVYSIPPPHYSVEQPMYDYDKNNHCCGCKHQENEKKPIIERQGQEVDKKTSESLVPNFLKDCPYPIMWVPPGYMNTGSNVTEKDKYSHEPVSLKTLEPAKRAEKREIDRDQQNGDGERFPSPLFWLSSQKKEVGNDVKEKNVDLVARNELTDEKKKQTINDETESDTSGKHVVQKVIPVKQVAPKEEKKISKCVETNAKSDYVENTECKSSSKASKLPPVCLRIEPLPRKKKTSRSPSPSGDNERSKDTSVNDPKSSQPTSEESKKNLEDENKGNIKTIEVTNAANNIEKDNVSATKGDESQKGGVQGQSSECEICEMNDRKNLSEHEAALIIQSVYRGFEVRKSQPLMKLRQISEVKKQVVELRNFIQDLESSSTAHVDEKQKLVIGETIMSILLKLDTIQGLHPIVRDVRKSVAKELVGLQEKLDSLTYVKPEAPIYQNLSTAEQVVHTKDDGVQEKSDQGQFKSNNDVKVMESDSILCENHEVEVTDHQDHDDSEACDAYSEPQVELNEGKFDQVLNRSDSINGVESTEFVDNGGGVEAHDIKFVEQNNGEQNNDKAQLFEQPHAPVEDLIQEKFDSNVETTESRYDIRVDQDVETADFKDDVGTELLINLEQPVALESQPIFVEDGDQLDQVNRDLTDGRFETDLENVFDDPAIEMMESQDNNNIEDDRDDTVTVETKADVSKEDAAKAAIQENPVSTKEAPSCTEIVLKADLSKEAVQEDFIVSTEEAPKVDDVDSSTEIVVEDVGRVPSKSVTSGDDDKRLTEENEKLRLAMEELMKAGNQQLSVIKELTGRVKDLEKKLSRNKKIKVNKKCNRSSRRCGIQEEVRDCFV
ncbi:LOW QUALITY PROTEIN: BAG family molecular chaperone regulator 6 [Rutidosis leptorrhynchoides]|uniref:LOW QUALITY PROTEIN: BAG family molecular chaperone regulator 6 n=1 Tax=Rutidosis leptorrhynchoides TaxID=125765 RepID=UPI003A98FA71